MDRIGNKEVLLILILKIASLVSLEALLKL